MQDVHVVIDDRFVDDEKENLMPKFQGPINGAPCWVDLTSGDLEGVKPFYTALFGWEYDERGEEYGGYNLISINGETVGGAMQFNAEFMGPNEINAWAVYFATDDAEKSLKLAQENGGQMVTPAMQVGDEGTMATAIDNGGAMYGLWQPANRKGFDKWGEHGFPGWFELHTRDFDKVKTYYEAVLELETKDMDMEGGPSYATIEANGESQAGIFDSTTSLPDGASSFWAVYFIVDDTDVAVNKAKELGGTVMVEPTDSPFGRMSLLQDPKGTFFFVISGNES